jgi:formylglycine-generating enzyme required for sulfatase activity
MAGNVWEWTASRYCDPAYAACKASDFVIRGGPLEYSEVAIEARSAIRYGKPRFSRDATLGFRCAR